jgi:hypothetical protein
MCQITITVTSECGTTTTLVQEAMLFANKVCLAKRIQASVNKKSKWGTVRHMFKQDCLKTAPVVGKQIGFRSLGQAPTMTLMDKYADFMQEMMMSEGLDQTESDSEYCEDNWSEEDDWTVFED